MVEWESGEVTYEPLTLISKDDPITCAVYAKKHDLLDTTGWKHLKRYAKTSKRLIRAVKQSRIRQVRASVRYQHGFQVPKDYNDAMRLDKENGNTHWQDAMDLELTQIHEYKVFKDTGKAKFHNGKVVTPDGFQKIRVHFVYAVKHDGQIQSKTCCRWTPHQGTCRIHLFWSGFLEESQNGCFPIPAQQFGNLGSRCR